MDREFLDDTMPARNTALVREAILARRWGKSVRTLQRWRRAETGPTYIRIGNSIFYTMADILAYEGTQRHGEVQV